MYINACCGKERERKVKNVLWNMDCNLHIVNKLSFDTIRYVRVSIGYANSIILLDNTIIWVAWVITICIFLLK